MAEKAAVYRLAEEEEWEDLVDFADMVFSRDHAPHDFETLIPRVYGAGARYAGIHRIAVSEGRIRALVACLPQELRVGGQDLTCGFIGTVSVHPRARGEGHMKKLMADWNTFIDGNYDLAVLGGQRQRYGYFGYTPAGLQYTFTVDKANIRHALRDTDVTGLALVPFREEDAAAALKMHEKRSVQVVRTEESFAAALRGSYCEPVSVLKDGSFVGFLSGKKPEIAEICLPEELIAPVFKLLFEEDRDYLTVTVPVTDPAAVKVLRGFAETWTTGPELLCRVVSFRRVIGAFLQAKADTAGVPDGRFAAWFGDEALTVEVAAGKVRVAEGADEGAPHYSREEAQDLVLSPGNGGGPAGWFPLPLFWYRADEF